MSKGKSLGLSVLFLAIALFVCGTLLSVLRTNYAPNGQSPALTETMQLLQRT